MKKHLLVLTILLLSFSAYSQIIFEKGYYVDNADNKIDCLIKNVDWIYNPTKFQYKLSENSEIITLNTDNVKAFGVDNGDAFVNSQVEIDRSTNIVNDLTYEKNQI